MVNQDYFGFYDMHGFQITMIEVDGELAAAVPGVPAGYEIRLEALPSGRDASERFRMHGGPLDGSLLAFLRGEDGTVRAIQAENFELTRLTPEEAARKKIIERLTAPSLALTPEKKVGFQALLNAILANPGGGAITYDLPYPKHEFVQYTMAQDVFIFHGSNNCTIEIFRPTRTSVELYDRGGSGNLQAVYGTHDGLWAMFFAVVDRARLRGSIRNGVMYFHNRAGEPLAVYNFSINQEQLPEQPWIAGALYFLPRGSFERQRVGATAYSNEWACRSEVRPLARLDVAPEDFPFLSQIGGHDDGFLLRNNKLAEAIHSAALSASLEGARFTITIPDNPEIAQVLAEWIETQQALIPSAQFTVSESAQGQSLTIDNLPPAYQHVFGDAYRDLLDRETG